MGQGHRYLVQWFRDRWDDHIRHCSAWVQVWALVCIPAPWVLLTVGGSSRVAQVIGSLPPAWETWMESQASSIGRHLRNESVYEETPLSLCLLNK